MMDPTLLVIIAKAGTLSLADLATRFTEPLDKLRSQLLELANSGEIIVGGKKGKAPLDDFFSGIDALKDEAASSVGQQQVSRERLYQFLNENPSFESTDVRLSSAGFHTATG